MKIATVDVGSYSCRLSVAELKDGKIDILHEEGRITSLSSGVKDTGLISEERIEETIKVLEDFRKKALELGAQKVVVVGTEVFRKAKNTEEFIRRVKEKVGLELKVITPEEEGRLAYLSVAYSLKPSGRVLVIDQGGGSTEFVFGEGFDVESITSFPFGIVNLTEEFIHHDPPTIYELESLKNFLDEEISKILRPVDTLVGLGGTITTLYALQHGIFPYNGELVHGRKLSLDQIMFWLETLSSMKAKDRISTFPQIEEKRATVIIPGILIFYRAMVLFGKKEILVSDWGLKEGLIVKEVLSAKG